MVATTIQGISTSESSLMARIVASRTSGVSPFTVMFSAETTTEAGRDEHDIFRELGYAWDFNDSGSGTFSNTTRNQSKNTITGGPMVAHTFEVADGSGSTDFVVLCNVKTPEGKTDQASVTITVQAQDDYYSGANTIAISNTETPGSWHLNSYTGRDVPSGYTEYASLAAAKTAGVWDNCAGKRIMLKRGDDFSGEGTLAVLTGNHDYHITWFGNTADARPIIGKLYPGSGNATGSGTMTDTIVADAITTFGNDGFTENAYIDGLRCPEIVNPMSYQHITIHDCDMDYEGQSAGGEIDLCNKGDWIWRASITDFTTATFVPFPKGCYVSDTTIIGSDTEITGSNSPVVNMGAFNYACITWLALIGLNVRSAYEHNIRTQGTQRYAVHDCDILGEHFATGGKSCITMRGAGYNQVGDYSALDRNSSAAGFDNMTDTNQREYLPSCGKGVIQRCTASQGTVGNAGAVTVDAMPTNNAALELIEDVLIRDIVMTETVLKGNQDAAVCGRWNTITEITYTVDGVARNDDTTKDLNTLTNNNVVNGVVIGTINPMLETPPADNRLDQDGETAHVLPVPDSPRA